MCTFFKLVATRNLSLKVYQECLQRFPDSLSRFEDALRQPPAGREGKTVKGREGKEKEGKKERKAEEEESD